MSVDPPPLLAVNSGDAPLASAPPPPPPEEARPDGTGVPEHLPAYILVFAILFPILDFSVVLRTYFNTATFPAHMRHLAIAHLAIVPLLVAMVCISLLYAWRTSPGHTATFVSAPDRCFPFVTPELLASLAPCPKCGLPKPLRAHHCGKCNRCVLRMDHHCPVIGNCVGLRNFRSFVALLLWAAISSSIHGTFCVAEAVLDHFSTASRMLSIVSALISLTITMNVGGFAAAQILHAVQNRTMLEQIGREEPRYDIGARANLCQFFGTPLGMLCPVPNDRLSGFEWCLSEYQSSRIAAEPAGTP
jgi:hypothetical protein